MPEAFVPVELYFISHAPVEDFQRATSALPSPSKSNEVLPGGTGGGGVSIAFEELVFEKNPKNERTESPIENRKAVAGETGFAISKPSGSCGVLKKLTVETKLFATLVLIVKTVETNLAESVSDEL